MKHAYTSTEILAQLAAMLRRHEREYEPPAPAFNHEEIAVRHSLEQIAPLCDPDLGVEDAVACMLAKDVAGEFKGARKATLAKLVVKILEAGPLFVSGVGTLHLKGGPGSWRISLEPISWLD